MEKDRNTYQKTMHPEEAMTKELEKIDSLVKEIKHPALTASWQRLMDLLFPKNS